MHRTWSAFVAVLTLSLGSCVASPLPPGSGGAVRPPASWPGGSSVATVRCESFGAGTQRCAMETRGGVRLVHQLSAAACEQGRNWGWDVRGVWVSHGCGAVFESVSSWPGSGVVPPFGANVVRCESRDGRMRRCPIDGRDGVRLVRQLSGVRCVQGRNWGWNLGSVWVSQGCRADFTTGRGAGWPGMSPAPGGGFIQTLRCESRNGRRQRCAVQVRVGVDLVRQLSAQRCVRGRTWGWDRAGIWVDGGCRGEFRVR
ncbi:MAG TPA: DUF3011 domain-containing protein [Luteimonas sp.]|nr:DUF3011 domain-containing protein [Luteimonas sp.]